MAVFVHSIAVFLLITMSTLSSASVSEETGRSDVIILFDQSMSMNSYNSKTVSELWVLSFINTFELPYNLVFAGFSESVVEYARLSTENPASQNEFSEKVSEIKMNGLVTDFEPPIRYLDEYGGNVSLAVIFTDGRPDIWDRNLGYLSRSILNDQRYQNLNKEYLSLKQQGKSAKELYKLLNHKYEKRNNEIIPGLLKKLKIKYGERLIFFDLSKKYSSLSKWADISGAGLLGVSSVGNDFDSVQGVLKDAFSELQITAARLIAEELPESYERKLRLSPGMSMEGDISNPPVNDLVKSDVDKRPEQPPMLLILVVVLVSALIVIRLKRRNIEKQMQVFVLLDETLFVDSLRKKIGSVSSASVEVARKFIDDEIEKAAAEGNSLKVKLLELEKVKFRFNRRIDLRVPVPDGAMDVVWRNKQGNEIISRIIDVSIHGLLFEASGFDADKIDKIRIYHLDQVLKVKLCRIRRRSDDLLVAILDEFNDNVSERMIWVENLSRIQDVSVL